MRKIIEPEDINRTIAELIPNQNGYLLGGDRQRYPMDFLNNPEGTVMLMEMLVNKFGLSYTYDVLRGNWKGHPYNGAVFKAAVVFAFLAANGIAIEGESLIMAICPVNAFLIVKSRFDGHVWEVMAIETTVAEAIRKMRSLAHGQKRFLEGTLLPSSHRHTYTLLQVPMVAQIQGNGVLLINGREDDEPNCDSGLAGTAGEPGSL